MNANPRDLDGVDLWFFGGTPGPDDVDMACTFNQHSVPKIDEDDANIPAFAHRCNCGKQAVSRLSGVEGRAALVACLV